MNKIPKGTQYIESGCGEKGFRKYEKGCWWFFEGYWRHVDWKMGDLIPVSEHPFYVSGQDAWNGEGLPPVGATIEIEKGPWVIREGSDVFIGKPLTVVAVFKTGTGLDMVAVDGGRAMGCEVFRASMAKLVRTAEQIAAEEKRNLQIEQLASLIAGYMGFDDPRVADKKLAVYLFDHDFRKQVAP